MGWRERAKKDSQGKWLKFDADTPKHIVTFLGEPKIVEKESTMGERKGERYNAYEFPVLRENEEKILSVTQRSLLRLIVDEDEEESIIGKTYSIKCLDLTKKSTWKLKEIAGPDITKWKEEHKKEEDDEDDEEEEEKSKKKAKKKQVDEEDEDDTGKVEDKDKQDEKAKDKFKAEVAKRAKKVKAQEEKEAKEAAESGKQCETEDGSRPETATVE